MTITTIVEFIKSRLDEDEAAARDASPGPWSLNPDDPEQVIAVDGIDVADAFALSGPQTRATAAHIARHDPARVLAGVAAKRRVVEAHPIVTGPRVEPFGIDEVNFGCGLCHSIDPIHDDGIVEAIGHGYCDTLLALASEWADHPDYDEA